MRYKDIIHFEPINSVIELTEADDAIKAVALIKSYIFSQKVKEDLNSMVVKNLAVHTSVESKGIQIVGSYGTGKSHLMSVLSVIAENSDMLTHIEDVELRKTFGKFAGYYKAIRFEVGTSERTLKDIVFEQIEKFLKKEGLDFKFNNQSTDSWKLQIQRMMAEFEDKFPDKHFLVVVDELLEYLKGRNARELNNDLMLLRQLGEACDHSRFKIMFGVQELLYRAPEFQSQADALQKVEARFDDFILTKDAIAFVVKARLLKKDEHQKKQIREHLSKFTHLFGDMASRLNEYVDMFPVHPRFIERFERVKYQKNERKILSVLTQKFEKLADETVPTDAPGLITYNTYWTDLISNASNLIPPDIQAVKNITDNIYDKINTHFTGARASRKSLAKDITDCLAINILSDDFSKKNGAMARTLQDDLCCIIPHMNTSDLIFQIIETTAKDLVIATSGSYVERNEINQEYFIRTEVGRNYDQDIRFHAENHLKRNPQEADAYFYDFMIYVLRLTGSAVKGYNIYNHWLEWKDKKFFRTGYIFFGNPTDRSTTQPIQQFYLYFTPIFGEVDRDNLADEVYFDLRPMSEQFRELILLCGAAKALRGTSPSDQHKNFDSKITDFQTRAIALFEKECRENVKIWYNLNEKPMKAYPSKPEGTPFLDIFDSVAVEVLNETFTNNFPDFPAFTLYNRIISPDNFDAAIKAALRKIANPNLVNREGENILAGLGLWNGTRLDTEGSSYAKNFRQKLEKKGAGKVLNRDEVLRCHYSGANEQYWYDREFNLDYQLHFLIMAVMVHRGELEISYSPNRALNANNLDELTKFTNTDFFDFQYIQKPREAAVASLRELFLSLGLPDFAANPTVYFQQKETFEQIRTAAITLNDRVVRSTEAIKKGLILRGIPILTDAEKTAKLKQLEDLRLILDRIPNLNTEGKLRTFNTAPDDVRRAFEAKLTADFVEDAQNRIKTLGELVNYLDQAQHYVVPSETILHEDIKKAVADLADNINADPDTRKRYEASLRSLVDRYADYYINAYTKYTLSRTDTFKKQNLLNSENRLICDELKDSGLVAVAAFEAWVNDTNNMKEANAEVTREKVKMQPYHDFNPRDFVGKPLVSVSDMEARLDDLLNVWLKNLQGFFKDPSVVAKTTMLETSAKKVADAFVNNTLTLTQRSAKELREVVRFLAKDIQTIDIFADDIQTALNKPMTYDEATAAFKKLLDDKSRGFIRDDVRFIFK